MKYVRIYLVLFWVNVLIALGVGMWMPDYRTYLVNEDSLLENLSAFFFFSTFFLGFLLSIKCKNHRKALIVVSMVGLLGFLDEMSFGERLFALNMPHIGGVKIDAAHDFFYLGYKVISDYTHSHAALVYLLIGVGVTVVVRVVSKYRHKLIDMISSNDYKQTYLLALFSAFLIFVALIIDLDIVEISILYVLEEILEMNAAVALLFCCLSLYNLRFSDKISKEARLIE